MKNGDKLIAKFVFYVYQAFVGYLKSVNTFRV